MKTNLHGRTLDTTFVLIAVAVAATLAPAWWWAIDELASSGDGAVYKTSFSAVASLASLAAMTMWIRGRRGLSALLLIAVAVIAPTGFAYVGNLLCLVVAVFILLRLRSG